MITKPSLTECWLESEDDQVGLLVLERCVLLTAADIPDTTSKDRTMSKSLVRVRMAV
jgi:hypothetical protein